MVISLFGQSSPFAACRPDGDLTFTDMPNVVRSDQRHNADVRTFAADVVPAPRRGPEAAT
jgi:hypothetical protein